MSIGVLIPTEKETEKGRAGKSSMVYKCMMLKCDLDTEVEDKDIKIKLAYNTQDLMSPYVRKMSIYIHFLVKCIYVTNIWTK